MKKIFFALAALCALVARAQGDDPPYKPFTGSYMIYSGHMFDERRRPTKTDRKISVAITGATAKEFFDSMSPDEKYTCSNEKGERIRTKGDVFCAYAPSDGYNCFFGFNLRTGKSITGGGC